MQADTFQLPAPEFLTISSKPSAPISHTFIPASSSNSKDKLVVFVNGLGLPAASWLPGILTLKTILPSPPAILTYDRFGQGLTKARDPIDDQPGKELGHDLLDVAIDLHEIIQVIATTKLGLSEQDFESGKLQVLMIGASIGAPVARLYAQRYMRIVAGMILLDSNICNVNYSDIWPDPEAPGFDPKIVVDEDCTFEQYLEHRKKLVGMFDLRVKNPENLDRSNSPVLLPYADSPMLVGPGGKGPFLSVVGHDPEAFANIGFAMMGTPKSLSRKFMNAYDPF